MVIDSSGNRQINTYTVIEGEIDINGSGDILSDGSDDLDFVSGDLGGYWLNDIAKVANTDELGSGFRISLVGGVNSEHSGRSITGGHTHHALVDGLSHLGRITFPGSGSGCSMFA